MKKRICPICDQFMTHAYYCKTCKRIVRNPIVREINFYLNERHSQSESDCIYHQPIDLKPLPVLSPPKKPAALAVPPIVTSSKMPKPASSTKKKSGFSGVATVIVVSVILTSMFYIIGSEQKAVKEYDVDLGEYQEEVPEYQVLTDEEARDGGIPCNSQLHFDLEQELLQSRIEDLLLQRGYEIFERDTNSINEEYDDGSTWFSTWIVFNFQNAEGVTGGLWIDSDTATGKVHEIYIIMSEQKESISLAAAIVSLRSEEAMLFGQGTIPDSLEEDLIHMADGEGVNWENVKLSLQGDFYEDQYSIVICPIS